MINRLCSPVAFTSTLVFCMSVVAADGKYRQFVEQLDSAHFSQRQAASKQLRDAGEPAIPTLAEAAQQANREVSTRAIEILRQHSRSGSDELQAAARGVLEKLATSDDQVVARRAQQALAAEQTPPGNLPFPRPPAIVGNPFPLQLPGGRIRTKVTIANGTRQVESQRDGRTVKLKEEANGAIQLEVTEKDDDREKTKKYTAKNAQELKQNHPDAYKIYQQQAQQFNGVQRGRAAGQIRPRVIPRNHLQAIENSKQPIQELIAKTQQKIAVASKDIQRRQKLIDTNDGNLDQHRRAIELNKRNMEAHRQMVENLEKHIQSIDQIKKRFEGRGGF